MKLISKIVVFFSFLSIAQVGLADKPIEILFDGTTQNSIFLNLQEESRNTSDNSHAVSSLKAKQLKIENIGKQPLVDCFPSVNKPSCINLERLASYLIEEKYPLLALFKLWDSSIIKDDTLILTDCHPLDILLFKGACSTEAFDSQFIKLCQAIGIQTRQANIRGGMHYDFSTEQNEWNFLDLKTGQHYMSIDNRKLASSEEIMDDPFLALRIKHDRKAHEMDYKQSWQNLARFDILEPASAPEVIFDLEDLPNRPAGFILYPNEQLIFETLHSNSEATTHERRMDHIIQLQERELNSNWTYASPIPLKRIENRSGCDLFLPLQNVHVKSGEGYTFSEDNLFNLPLEFLGNAQGTLVLSGTFTSILFPTLNEGQNTLYLGSKDNSSLVRATFTMEDCSDQNLNRPAIQILNQKAIFDYCSPFFELENIDGQALQSMEWQISPDSNFHLVPPNFDQMEPYRPVVTLSPISETLLGPSQTYYFRVRGNSNGNWGPWSPSFAFKVNKPAAAEEVEFDKVEDNLYEINWERMAEESEDIDYLVFGSNALDFIPSIYCDKQINGIVDGVIVDEDTTDNLVAITKEPKIQVKGGLAYYRIVSRKRGQLSVPSELIHVYDYDLIQPRNVLQVVEDDNHVSIAKRTLLPVSYPATEVALPHVFAESHYECSLLKIQTLLKSAVVLEGEPYRCPDGISQEVFESWQQYLLPCNHALKPKLDRIFSQGRVTFTPETCKKAGFTRNTPQRWSRVVASPHGELRGFWCKMYCDNEPRVLNCHPRWINRIYGAECIRKCIRDNHLEKDFTAPHKWMYVLPNNFPKHYKDDLRYVEKYTILICEDARPVDHSKNKKMYKNISDKRIIKGFYTIIQSCGLWDSVFVFNNPHSKDGRIWFIDCEGHHRWPINYNKMTKNFSSDMGAYWERCFKEGSIPDGQSYRGLRRTDR